MGSDKISSVLSLLTSLNGLSSCLEGSLPTAFFQHASRYLKKYPQFFEPNIVVDAGRFLTLTSSEFKAQRSPKSLMHCLCSLYLLRKQLLKDARLSPEKRHLAFRMFASQLSFPFGKKRILGIALALHLPDKYEYFDDQNIEAAVQQLLPTAQVVRGSFFLAQTSQDSIRTLYVEVEKEGGGSFSLEERKKLSLHLGEKIEEKIERLTHPVFMGRNEEEVMKHILFLSKELKNGRDLPQVMVSFEKSSRSDLVFTVILVRLLKGTSRTLDLLSEEEIQFTTERTQIVGLLRKRYPKEATVFRVQVSKSSFLRSDSSVNSYQARQKIVALLQDYLGGIRDFTGGIILKQQERLSLLKEVFKDAPLELIENLFYSISPIEQQVLLPMPLLRRLFLVVLESNQAHLPKKEAYFYKVSQEEKDCVVVIKSNDPAVKMAIEKRLGNSFRPPEFSYFSFTLHGRFLLGYIYPEVTQKQNDFLKAIQEGIGEWQRCLQSHKTLRINFQDWPYYALDPRLGGDNYSYVVLKALYEGLTCKGKDGRLTLACAESVAISEDLKKYVFKLRNCYWSNGDKIVAYDFEYAWKMILSPHFDSPFTYLFYPIKNAQLAKAGKIPSDQLGIRSLDDSSLFIELERPLSYFLELLTHPLFSPVNHRVDQKSPLWAFQDGSGYVCNGPFFLKTGDSGWCEMAKNPRYWDKNAVKLDNILVIRSNAQTALEMFLKNEIDWLGRPMRPWESSFAQVAPECQQTFNAHYVLWYVFNVQRFPFHNKNVRKAFAHSIDRTLLSAPQFGAASPAMSPLPLMHSQYQHQPVPERDVEAARAYFERALHDLHMTKNEFPAPTIIHAKGGTRDAVAQEVRQQIEEALGVRCTIEKYPLNEVFNRLIKGEYQLGTVTWTALVDDPRYTLNALRYANERMNVSKWENNAYQEALDAADNAIDGQKRQQYLREAESILIEETPIIPIFYEVQQFLKKKHVLLPPHVAQGDIDFKWIEVGEK